MPSFSAQVADFIEDAIGVNEEIQRAAVISLFSIISDSSPVGESNPAIDYVGGRFRSNWFASDETPSTKVTDSIISEEEALIRLQAEIRSVRGGTFTFTNNLPYAEVIEFGGYNYNPDSGKTTAQGFSTSAPHGVVRVNAQKWSENLEEAARKNVKSKRLK